MSLYKDPATTLLSLLEKENNLVLEASDYDFSTPTPATPPEGSEASYNTTLTVTNNNPAAPYIGSVDIFYNRLNLADLALLADIYVHAENTTTTHGLLPSLNRRYGLNLKEEDIVNLDTIDLGNYREALLKATPSSLGWVGELKIGVVEGDLLLDDYLSQPQLGGLNYPTEDLDKPFAYFYSYWRDFSDHHETLNRVKNGDPIGLEIVSVLNDVTDDVWVATGVADYSLEGSVISYAGSTEGYIGSNQDYDGVIVVELDSTKCTALSGSLLLHHSADPYATLGF